VGGFSRYAEKSVVKSKEIGSDLRKSKENKKVTGCGSRKGSVGWRQGDDNKYRIEDERVGREFENW